jgi:hypothetical protein
MSSEIEFRLRIMTLLKIPNKTDVDRITKSFLLDLQSFTFQDYVTKEIRPVICSVCDSMPLEAQWSTRVDVNEFVILCKKCNLEKCKALKVYGNDLINQYTAKDDRLKQFVLSPETHVNSENEILVCKQCLSELRTNQTKKTARRRPPAESIINGYMIGDAPVDLTNLNPVELSLISKTVTQAQSWIFFAGSHQSIKGWHTFFKGRPADNVGNLTLMTESGWKGHILVVMCGPFTSEQDLLTRARVRVDPNKVIAAWVWLKHNNYRYSNLVVPPIDSIQRPYILDDER